MYTKNFKDVGKNDVGEVGGKGASLGELTKAGIEVPPGFVVTAQTFRDFSETDIPTEVIDEILEAFDELGAERVAVRSSALAEDSSNASWAGQLESYLNVTRENLIDRIKDCWESIKAERALSYAKEHESAKEDLVVAVVVQKMVDSEAAGVMFTKNPINNDDNYMMVEAGFGLGELLVQGVITPDNYIIIKETGEVSSKELGSQEVMLVFKDNRNIEVSVPEELMGEYVLSDDMIGQLAEVGRKIEKHYNSAQDIEWAIEDGKIYIVQSRPITT